MTQDAPSMTGDTMVPDFEAYSEKAKTPLRAWLRLFSCSAMIEREIASRLQAQFGVSLARFDFLAQLYRNPKQAMAMGELGQRLMVTGGSITGLTDRLEADNLVVRSANPKDRRSHLIKLTDKGRAAFADMAQAHDLWLQDIFAGINEPDLARLIDGLGNVKQGASRARETRNKAAERGKLNDQT